VIGSARIVACVTGVAVRRNYAKRAAGVALGTEQPAVTVGQRETTVVVRSWRPGCGTMALFAGLWEALACVIGRTGVIRRMAGVTIGRNRPERSACMALRTE
jgi:hypothetical protein